MHGQLDAPSLVKSEAMEIFRGISFAFCHLLGVSDPVAGPEAAAINAHLREMATLILRNLYSFGAFYQWNEQEEQVQVETLRIPYQSRIDEETYERDREEKVTSLRLGIRGELINIFVDQLEAFREFPEDDLKVSELQDLQEEKSEIVLVGRLLSYLERYQEERELHQLQYALFEVQRSSSDYLLEIVYPMIQTFVASLGVTEEPYEEEYGDDEFFDQIQSVGFEVVESDMESQESVFFDGVLEGDEDLLDRSIALLSAYHEELLDAEAPTLTDEESFQEDEDGDDSLPAFRLSALRKSGFDSFAPLHPQAFQRFVLQAFQRRLNIFNRIPDQQSLNMLKVALQWEKEGLDRKGY